MCQMLFTQAHKKARSYTFISLVLVTRRKYHSLSCILLPDNIAYPQKTVPCLRY